jgi:hypothetical protein
MNRWMKRRIERSRARCEKAEEQHKKDVRNPSRNNTSGSAMRQAKANQVANPVR